ncbi:MAG: hypothetical protein M3P93_00970 [Actinomycetota bacterium]|nr:hypothetical protein [Actinomycetota bacterium]
MFDYTEDIVTGVLHRTDLYDAAPEDLIGEWVVAVGNKSHDVFILPCAQARILADSIYSALRQAEAGNGPGPD